MPLVPLTYTTSTSKDSPSESDANHVNSSPAAIPLSKPASEPQRVI